MNLHLSQHKITERYSIGAVSTPGLTTRLSIELATCPSLHVCFVLKGAFLHGFQTGKGLYVLFVLTLVDNYRMSW